MIRVSNIKIDIDDSMDLIKEKVCKKIRVKENEIVEYSIYKESIDARKSDRITFVYTVDIVLKNEEKILKKNLKDIAFLNTNKYEDIKMGDKPLMERPVIVGFGPAGIFAGLILAQRGYKPLILERGYDVDKRTEDISVFWETGKLSEKSNVQFGEGGAGTFSDGKLTTRMKDIRCEKVLSELVRFGAPKDILYSHKPHVGTDILKDVIKNIRNEILSLGGEVRFDSLVSNIRRENNKVVEIEINNNERIKAQHIILAVGHSARDTYRMLHKNNIEMQQKPFAMGARIEHPQGLINKAQYGKFSNHKRLGSADYRLAVKAENGRNVYTFCMCPGGSVIASASTEGHLVTNGMSEHARDRENANSGLLVNIETSDYGSSDPLAGIDFQEKYEKMAFELGGSNFNAPCQLVGDFINKKLTENIGSVKPSYMPGVKLTDLSKCLPDFVVEAMRDGLLKMEKKLENFAMNDAILTGVETRSSAPVRINREQETLESVNTSNLFPCGEGAGYAGGIVTAAVDGIRCAEKIIEKYSPKVNLAKK